MKGNLNDILLRVIVVAWVLGVLYLLDIPKYRAEGYVLFALGLFWGGLSWFMAVYGDSSPMGKSRREP